MADILTSHRAIGHMTTRLQLKEQVKLLEQLEQLESLQDSPVTMEVSGYTNRSFYISGVYAGEPTVNSRLNDIARKHFQAMIESQIALIKSCITIELQDKDKS